MTNSASPKLKNLNPFVGKWHTTGEVLATDSQPAISIDGTDTYKWMAGGHFLIHSVDVQMGNDKSEALEIIGYDEKSDTFPMYSYDNQGNQIIMQASEKDGIWSFIGESMRFNGSFSQEGNVMNGTWELNSNGKWHQWMNITLTKM